MLFQRLSALLLLFFLLSQPLHARQRSSPRELEQAVREGKELYEGNHYVGAIEVWTEVLKKDPWNQEVKLLIERALKEYEELTSHLENGYALLEAGEVEGAQGEFDYVQENSSSDDAELQDMVSRGFEAVRLARRDQHYAGLIGEGDRHLEREEFDAALASYEEAQEFFPEGEVAPLRIELAMERRLEAELGARLRSLREEGRKLFAEDKLKPSKSVWEEVIELKPGDEEAGLFLSKINFKLQEQEKLLEMARGYFENGQRLFDTLTPSLRGIFSQTATAVSAGKGSAPAE